MTLNFHVTKRDASGRVQYLGESIHFPALLKHFALAGMGRAPSVDKWIALPATFLMHWRRFYNGDLPNGIFGSLPVQYADPDQQRNFSRLIGRALIDYLLKKYDNVQITQNYEAVMSSMNIPITGTRGDLVGFQGSNIVAVAEAKGRTNSVSDRYMQDLKIQARRWPIQANITVVGVVENIYSGLSVKYYDPKFPTSKITTDQYEKIMENYYGSIINFIDFVKQENPEAVERSRNFIKISMLGFQEILPKSNRIFDDLKKMDFKLVIDKKVLESSIPPKIDSISILSDQFNYLDRDGIGIEISRNS